MNTVKTQDLYLNQNQNPEHKNVNVYLRMANSKSIKVQLPTVNRAEFIKLKIQQLIKVDIQNQILYYNGKELIDKTEVKLKEKAIIHIKSKKEYKENIVVNVIKHSPQEKNIFKLNFQYSPIKINPNSTIEEVLKQILQEYEQRIDLKRTKVIQCGRFLKLNKTFLQENIHTYTEIHLILIERLKQKYVQDDKQQSFLIESILERSSNTHLNHRLSKTDRVVSLLDEQYDQRPPQNAKFKLYQQIEQNNKEDEPETRRNILPNSFSNIKVSQFGQSQKYISKQITPLKFSFKEYKKYEGPKSVRECNCKQKTEHNEDQQHFKESSDKKLAIKSNLLKNSKLKHSKTLKTRVNTVF